MRQYVDLPRTACAQLLPHGFFMFSKNTIKLRSFEIINGEIIQRATSTNYKWYDEEFNYILLRQKDEVSLNELPKPDETIYFDNYIICKYAQPVKIKKLRK